MVNGKVGTWGGGYAVGGRDIESNCDSIEGHETFPSMKYHVETKAAGAMRL